MALAISLVAAIFCPFYRAAAQTPPAPSSEAKKPILWIPKVENGVVTLDLTDPKDASKFHEAIQFSGEAVWNKRPNSATIPGAGEISGPALVASGVGAGEAAIEFTITPDMEIVRFFVLGNSERSLKVKLSIDGREWSYKGIETSAKIPEKTEWKLNGKDNAGKTARIVFTKGETSKDSYLALVSGPNAVKDKPKPEGKPVVIAPYHVESKFKRTVKATLTISIHDPATKDGAVNIYLPIPPDLPSQQLQSVKFRCQQYPNIVPEKTTDTRDVNQKYLKLAIPIDKRTFAQPLAVTGEYIVDMYETRLMRGPARLNHLKLRCVPTENLGVYMEETSKNNWKNATFQRWIKENGLIKGANETDLDFAYRAYNFLRTGVKAVPEAFKGYFPTASEFCYEKPPTGCGDNQTILAAIYNANGIPVMTTGGRWALNPTPTQQLWMHQRVVFYCK